MLKAIEWFWGAAHSGTSRRSKPDIGTVSLLVDAAAVNFIRRPHTFGVVAASNLFGNILSDITAIIMGSMGLAASANADPRRAILPCLNPCTARRPDIAERGVVNPRITILSAAMMPDHVGLAEAARGIESAVAAVRSEDKIRTPDLGGSSSTQEVTSAAVERIQRAFSVCNSVQC